MKGPNAQPSPAKSRSIHKDCEKEAFLLYVVCGFFAALLAISLGYNYHVWTNSPASCLSRQQEMELMKKTKEELLQKLNDENGNLRATRRDMNALADEISLGNFMRKNNLQFRASIEDIALLVNLVNQSKLTRLSRDTVLKANEEVMAEKPRKTQDRFNRDIINDPEIWDLVASELETDEDIEIIEA